MIELGQKTCERLVKRGGWTEDQVLHRCDFPIGPRNTYSNIGYLAAGVAVVLLAPDPGRWAMGVALWVLGLGSAAYHGWKTTLANTFDWVGMYCCLLLLAAHHLIGNPWAAVAVFPTALIVALVFSFERQHFDSHMGVLFVAAVARPLWHGSGLAWVSVGLFAVGYLSWQLDKARKAGLWGHALWHLLTAGAMLALYLA